MKRNLVPSILAVVSLVAVLAFTTSPASARGSSGQSSRSSHHSASGSRSRGSHHRSSRGRRIKRNSAARRDFLRQTGYPHGRKGYVVDHVIPLECGGADTPSNMQWQTIEQAKAKDRTERNCASYR